MKCGGCVSTVENILKNYDDLENVSVNLLTESAYFEIKNPNGDLDKILANLEEKGFPSEIYVNEFSQKYFFSNILYFFTSSSKSKSLKTKL